ncbi:MAG: chromosomal replication initiator protein DnaA [Candidatus Cloacimonetes bacterium]|nr:chromosomal replication initiator protein DnaA [Candidatus Cloacimonadota bacterium]
MNENNILPVSRFLDKKIVKEAMLEFLKSKLQASAMMYVKTIFIKEFQNNLLILSLENEIIEKRLFEYKIPDLLLKFFKDNFYYDQEFEIQFIYEESEKEIELEDYVQTTLNSIPKEKPVKESLSKEELVDPSKILQSSPLKDEYTFETYVMGNSNRFAFEMAKSLSDAEIARINPLFIYGGVGLGKTHLLHAMAHNIRVKQPNARIIFSSCEELLNEYLNGVMKKDYNRFRTIREADALFIDDIQFLAGKEAFQEEFFHAFNCLNDRGKHVAVASDRTPDQLKGIEDRLISRFKGGMCVDIKLPDLETRMAIIKNLASSQNINFSDEIIDYFASSISSNVRELQGSFYRIISLASLNNHEIDKSLIDEGLSDYINREKPLLTPENIQRQVANKYGIEFDDLFSSNRRNAIAYPRQVAMYLIRELTGITLKDIANNFGKKDHVTVSHACNRVTEIIKTDRIKAQIIEDLRKKIERDFER